jgi:hypothetical protein
MHPIGTIVRLQIQRGSLKTGAKPNRRYDPAPILSVEQLQVSPDGVLGGMADAWIVDVHHRAHPATKNADGLHGVSVGFTSHYAAMRERFGARVVPGCAGENIILETDRRFTFDDLRAGLAIVDGTGQERVRLRVLDVARPCRPFTGWALGQHVEPEVLRDSLKFLDQGMRGFYCLGIGSGTVSLGDQVVLLQDRHD